MLQKPQYLTKEKLAEIEAELEYLRVVRRQAVAERIRAAKELTSAEHNADLDNAKNEQAFVEGRIRELEHIIENAVIIDAASHPKDRIVIGSRVSVVRSDGRQECYSIVGTAEANPRAGKISNESPVGQALLGRRVGEEVQVDVPGGVLRLVIREIG